MSQFFFLYQPQSYLPVYLPLTLSFSMSPGTQLRSQKNRRHSLDSPVCILNCQHFKVRQLGQKCDDSFIHDSDRGLVVSKSMFFILPVQLPDLS